MRITVFLGVLLALFVSSCDFMLKKDSLFDEDSSIYAKEENYFDAENEKENCDFQSGYRWSSLKNDCIRIFAEGFRLNPIELLEGAPEENELEDNDVSCFVVFDSNKDKAEFFLPNSINGVVIEETAVKGLFNKDGWELDVRGNMKLSYKGQLKFTAAKTIELKLIGTDEGFDEVVE